MVKALSGLIYLLYLFVSVGFCSYTPLPSPTRVFSGLENVHKVLHRRLALISGISSVMFIVLRY